MIMAGSPTITIPNVTKYENTKIVGIDNIKFGKNIIIDDFVFIHAKAPIIINDFVHIACFSSITGGERVCIGEFSAISQGARILTGTDDFTDWGFGNSTIDEKYRNTTRAPISIGKFCIIGANSVILPGVTIGEGSTVGACSVVTKDIDPWGVYIGNRRIRERNKQGVLKTYEKYLQDNG